MAEEGGPGAAPRGPHTRRTAVVVIAGIGDSPADSASQAAVEGLLRYGAGTFTRGHESIEWYPVPKRFGLTESDAPQAVKRFRLRSASGVDVDIYEAWWADLSRFPAAMRSSLIGLFGMLLQMASIGQAALRGNDIGAASKPDKDPTKRLSRAASVLGAIEWMVAVPILIITLLHLALVAGGAFAIWSGGDSVVTRFGLMVVGAGVIAVTVVLALNYGKRRFAADWVAIGLVLATVGAIAWRTWADSGEADRGIGDALMLVAMYPFRIAWMAIGALIVVLVGTLGVAVVTAPGSRRSTVFAQAKTALVSTAGSFGMAALAAVIYAAAGGALKGIAQRSTWNHGPPWCLNAVNDWTPSPTCNDQAGQAIAGDAFSWGIRLFGQFLVALAYVALAVITIMLLTFLITATIRLIRTRKLLGSLWDPTHLLGTVTNGAAIAVIPSGVFTLITWMPVAGGAVPGGSLTRNALASSSVPASLAAVGGIAVTLAFTAARFVQLTPGGVLRNQPGNEGVRSVLDRLYDISSFLREPPHGKGSQEPMPRARMMARFAALLEHISNGGDHGETRCDRLVVFAHSQGSVLATTLLSEKRPVEGDDPLVLPPEVALLTFGSPLRNIYRAALPVQYAWVDHLIAHPDEQVVRVNREWINYGANSDPVGRTVFEPTPDEPRTDGRMPQFSYSPFAHGDWCTGNGGHGKYWESEVVFAGLIKAVCDDR